MKLRPLFLLALPVLALSVFAGNPQDKKTIDPSGTYTRPQRAQRTRSKNTSPMRYMRAR